MNKITSEIFRGDSEFLSAVTALGRLSPIMMTGVCKTAYAPFCCALLDSTKRKLLFVVPEEKEAYSLCEELEGFGKKALVFPARDYVFDNLDAKSREWEHQRLGVLMSVFKGDFDVILAVPDALMQFTMPRSVLFDSAITLKRGETEELKTLCDLLVSGGYTNAPQVEGKGQFSVRGGILDVFPPQAENPIRIDFFGDEIDEISYFDVLDQRSFKRVNEVELVPAAELPLGVDARARIKEAINSMLKKAKDAKTIELLQRDKDTVENGLELGSIDKYFNHIFEENETLFDYMDDAIVLMSDTRRITDRAKAYYWEFSETVKQNAENGLLDMKNAVLMMSDSEFVGASEKRMISLDMFLGGKAYNYKDKFTLQMKQTTAFWMNEDVLFEDVTGYINSDYIVVMAVKTERSARELMKLFSEKGIEAEILKEDDPKRGVAYILIDEDGQYRGGFELTKMRFALITESERTGDSAVVRTKRSRNKRKGEKVMSYSDLSVGDYVVHENNGIGRYEGIQNLTVDGVSKDYIKIKYQGSDVLYVPCNALDLVSKYIGASDESVKLSKLGGTDWSKAKARAKANAQSIAKELIQLYAARMRKEGYAFSPDDDYQREFERCFEYVETYGQLNASDEIKQDMEKPQPMDRLLCGDVGFGKTEVALRAIFKCVNDGKQAAILVPTTILAMQHYNTMLSRFRSFPVKADVISRFKTKQQQTQTLLDLKKGKIDVIVGTHRLLQKDVEFSDLGLLVVDEEQRFGVTHKEKLKQMSENVDVLTLSATPIPRTLNMALSGIRDMSVLEEAPGDRMPVQTYVLEHDDVIINEAIKRELRRGGQVFYLHNNVDTIYGRAAKLRNEFPDANIAVGHGKMTREELSEIWESLVAGEIDILVCTTIIETGVDVPNANTLIIENADRFGLSQLHQIRGRVGRSTRKAYAYLSFKPQAVLNETATKRLEAIKEFTEFGSGFKIAMRDLEIRGAGDLLGAKQHGFIESVGYNMFIKILEDAVLEEKGEKVESVRDCTVDIAVDAYIPENYITVSQQRIDVYRKIALLENEEECIDLQTELIDRFGTIPQSVRNLMEISLIRNVACSLGIRKVSTTPTGILFFPENPDATKVTRLARMNGMNGKILYNAGKIPYFCYKMNTKEGKILQNVENILALYTEISQNGIDKEQK